MIRFMSDTPYAGVEQEMQHIPGFRPRRSGMVISHLSGCLEKSAQPVWKPCDRLCPVLWAFGGVGRGSGCQHLCKPRVPSDRKKKSVLFQNGHRERFMAMGEKCSRAIEEAATCSAVYLLSADRFLWSRALEVIDQEEIHFSKIHIHGRRFRWLCFVSYGKGSISGK